MTAFYQDILEVKDITDLKASEINAVTTIWKELDASTVPGRPSFMFYVPVPVNYAAGEPTELVVNFLVPAGLAKIAETEQSVRFRVRQAKFAHGDNTTLPPDIVEAVGADVTVSPPESGVNHYQAVIPLSSEDLAPDNLMLVFVDRVAPASLTFTEYPHSVLFTSAKFRYESN
jgi:hypothetical protein